MTSRRLGIGSKILIAFLAIAIAAVGIIGIISFRLASVTLEEESFNKLTAVREMKAGQITDYYQLIIDQIITLSRDPTIIDAMRALDGSVHSVGDELDLTDADRESVDDGLRSYYQKDYLERLIPNLLEEASVSDYWPEDPVTRILQSLYISANPYATGSKHLLDNPGDGSNYSQAHEIYHPIIRDFLDRFGYYDIFLVDVDTGGHISYSVFKEVDYGTSLLDGPYSGTGFADAYRAARDAGDLDFVRLVDFEPYAPSYNAPAAFIASPIFDGDEKIGVLVFQMPIDRINDIMTSHQGWSAVGLGMSGETYIVGDDFLLRTQSRFLIEDPEGYFSVMEEIGIPLATRAKIRNFNSTIGLQEAKTEGAEAALRGEIGTRIFPDYRGVPVLSSYKPLDIPDMNWVIMSEIDEAEAFAAVRSLTSQLVLVFGGLVTAIIVAAIAFSRSITRPINKLSANAQELAEGNLDVQVDAHRRDEIGDLARSFDVMRDSLKRSIRELRDINQHLEERVAERTAELEQANKAIGDQLSFTRTLLDTVPNPIFATGPDGRYVAFNQAYEEAHGMRREEWIGKTVMEIETLPLGERERYRAEDIELLESGGLKQTELDILYADGELHSVLQWVTTYDQADGSIGGILGIIADITQQKQMARQLEEAFQTIKIQRDRMEIELSFAREIQLNMLPLIFPAFPTRSELNVYATLHSAREVGGDFYDFYFLDDDHLCFVIADVSGKGAPGALLMAVSKTLIKSRAADDHEPASILTHVNNELSRDNESAMFVTVFLGIINVKTGELRYTNAGHNPPYIKRRDGTVEKVDAFHGPVIGALPGMTYGQDRVVLKPQDMIVLHTDGVTEAMDESDALFSDERYEALLLEESLNTPRTVIDGTVAQVRRHQGEAEQSDDITILAIQYEGRLDQDETSLRLVIKNRLEELGIVEDRFHEFSEQNEIPDGARQKVSIVLDELLNNVISYAYEDDDEHSIEVDIELSGQRLVTTIRDDGVPFNPFGLGTPDTSAPMAEREIGGLGIHLVRSMMDEYLYERRINRNVVTLVKMLSK